MVTFESALANTGTGLSIIKAPLVPQYVQSGNILGGVVGNELRLLESPKLLLENSNKNNESRLDYLRNKYGRLTPKQINDRANLRGAVKDRLDSELARIDELVAEHMKGLSKNQIKKNAQGRYINALNDELGPAVAGVLDTKTGKIYTRINASDGHIPKELNEEVKEIVNKMPKYVKEYYTHTRNGTGKYGGAHAEVLALGDALDAREGAEISDMICYVLQTGRDKKKMTKEGVVMPRCPHCEYITIDIGYFPEVLWYGKKQGRKYRDYGE